MDIIINGINKLKIIMVEEINRLELFKVNSIIPSIIEKIGLETQYLYRFNKFIT